MPPKFPLQPRRFAGKSRFALTENVFVWLQIGAVIFGARPFFWLGISTALLFIFYFLFFYAFLFAVILLPNIWSFFILTAFLIGNNYKIKIYFDFLLFLFQSIFAAVGLFFFYFFDFFVADLIILFILKYFIFIFLLFSFFVCFSFSPILILKHRMDIVTAIQSSISAVFKNYKAFLILFIFISILFFISFLTAGLALVIILPILAGTFYAAYNDIFEGV